MKSQPRKIEGAILQTGRIYKAGDEEALALVLPRADAERLIEKGALSGDWSGAVAEPDAPAVTRIDGKPLVRDDDGTIHDDSLDLSDEERANLPPTGEGDGTMATGAAAEPPAPVTPSKPVAAPRKARAKRARKPTTKRSK